MQHWDQFTQSTGLSKAQAKLSILEIARSLPTTERKLQSTTELGFAGNAVIEKISVLIEQGCALTIWQLTGPAGSGKSDTDCD